MLIFVHKLRLCSFFGRASRAKNVKKFGGFAAEIKNLKKSAASPPRILQLVVSAKLPFILPCPYQLARWDKNELVERSSSSIDPLANSSAGYAPRANLVNAEMRVFRIKSFQVCQKQHWCSVPSLQSFHLDVLPE